MLWMSLKKRRSLVGIVLALILVQTPMAAKCAARQVTVEGEIEGSTDNVKVIMEVTSTDRADLVTRVRQESSIEGSHFRVLGSFNTTSNVIAEETCSRRPRLVVIKLMRGDKVLDRQTLPIKTAFRLREKWKYEPRKSLVLHANGRE